MTSSLGPEAPASLSAAAMPLVAALRASGSREASYQLPGAELVLKLKSEGSAVVDIHTHHHDAVAVPAPVAGRFYHAASPGEPAVAPVGSQVAFGQPLGYLEAMKLIHPLLAPQAGWVTALAVADGAAVVPGQTVAYLRHEPPHGPRHP